MKKVFQLYLTNVTYSNINLLRYKFENFTKIIYLSDFSAIKMTVVKNVATVRSKNITTMFLFSKLKRAITISE